VFKVVDCLAVLRKINNERHGIARGRMKAVQPKARATPGLRVVLGYGFLPWNVKSCVWFPVTVLALDVTVTVPPAAIDASWAAVRATVWV